MVVALVVEANAGGVLRHATSPLAISHLSFPFFSRILFVSYSFSDT